MSKDSERTCNGEKDKTNLKKQACYMHTNTCYLTLQNLDQLPIVQISFFSFFNQSLLVLLEQSVVNKVKPI